MKISLRYIPAALAAVMFISFMSLSEDETGKFDIARVREAVEEQRAMEDVASPQAPRGSLRAEETLGAIMLRITGYLALVILVILGLFHLLKKTGVVGSSRIGGGSMDVLEALALGQGRYLLLVRVMDWVLVLAQGPQQITLIDKIEGQRAVEVIASTKGGTSIVQFKDMFNSFIGKAKKSS